jgi:hypothetical protein
VKLEPIKLRAEPVEDVVGLLADALERAKEGELRAVGLILVTRGGEIETQHATSGGIGHLLTAGGAYFVSRLTDAARRQ